MGPALLQFLVLTALIGAVLFAVNRWAARQRAEAARLEPPPQRPLPPLVPPLVPDLPDVPDLPTDRWAGTLDDASRQAVLLQEHVPPRPGARSHWGGLPSLPADTAWPSFTTDDGTERPLSFLVQVACDEVPETGRLGLLPDHGTLLVFLDLAWGVHWEWRVIWTPQDAGDLRPADPPSGLPPLYDSRATWGWPQDDADWPRLLPRWSFSPVLARARRELPSSDAEDDALTWPGRLDLVGSLEAIPGAIVPSADLQLGDGRGGARRPWSSFPHDWRAVLISTGHLLRSLDSVSRRPGADAALVERVRAELTTWAAQARGHDLDERVPAATSDQVWSALVAEPMAWRPVLRTAVTDAVDATLAAHPDPLSVLPDDALRTVRGTHALGRVHAGRLHVNTPDRMLSAPTVVQEEGWERARAGWLLLLELSSAPQIGHHLGEGVLQLWIRPEDLAARRFDRVELTAEAY